MIECGVPAGSKQHRSQRSPSGIRSGSRRQDVHHGLLPAPLGPSSPIAPRRTLKSRHRGPNLAAVGLTRTPLTTTAMSSLRIDPPSAGIHAQQVHQSARLGFPAISLSSCSVCSAAMASWISAEGPAGRSAQRCRAASAGVIHQSRCSEPQTDTPEVRWRGPSLGSVHAPEASCRVNCAGASPDGSSGYARIPEVNVGCALSADTSGRGVNVAQQPVSNSVVRNGLKGVVHRPANAQPCCACQRYRVVRREPSREVDIRPQLAERPSPSLHGDHTTPTV